MVFEGRAAIGYDHCHDAEVFCLGLALDERCAEGCPERIGDDPDEEEFLRGIWKEGDDRGSAWMHPRARWRSGRAGLDHRGGRVRRLRLAGGIDGEEEIL